MASGHPGCGRWCSVGFLGGKALALSSELSGDVAYPGGPGVSEI